MKKMHYLLLLTLAFTTFQSFTLPEWEVSEIMQAIMDLEDLEQVWDKDEAGNITTPIYLVAHDHFPETPKFSIGGQQIKIISPEAASQLEKNTPYIEVTDFKVKKGKKARLEFTYKKTTVKVNMRKQEGNWVHRTLSIIGKGKVHKSLDWTF